MVFYADTYFVLNFIADFLLLMAAGGICAVFTPRWRLFSAAAFGALYTVFAFLGPEIFSGVFMYLISAGMMLVIAYGTEKRFIRLYLVFFALAAAFGGVIYALNISFGENVLFGAVSFVSPLIFVTVFLAAYFLFSVVFRRSGRDGTKLSKVEIVFRQRSGTFSALQDTGNSLSDPLTGRKVMVVSYGEVKKLFPEIEMLFTGLKSSSETEEILTSMGYSFLLVPYKAVGTESGPLTAFRPDKIIIDGKINSDYIVAVSQHSVGDGGAYTALMGAA